jgi:hypothetical protein
MSNTQLFDLTFFPDPTASSSHQPPTESSKMTSASCKIEDFIAQSENYYAAYPMNGTFPFLTSPLAEDSPLRLAYPKFINRVTEIINSHDSITLVKSSAEEREIVAADSIISTASLCLTVTGEFTHYHQAVKEIHTHVLTHMNGHDFTVEMINCEQVQQHLMNGPGIYSVQRNVIVEHSLSLQVFTIRSFTVRGLCWLFMSRL